MGSVCGVRVHPMHEGISHSSQITLAMPQISWYMIHRHAWHEKSLDIIKSTYLMTLLFIDNYFSSLWRRVPLEVGSSEEKGTTCPMSIITNPTRYDLVTMHNSEGHTYIKKTVVSTCKISFYGTHQYFPM